VTAVSADTGIDVSVIIVNWNTRQLVLNCIRSIVDSDFAGRAEIVVVDNASSDGSAEEIERQFPEAIVLRNARNEGFSKANNRGIAEARGKYLCVCNSDIVVARDTLQRLVDRMEGNPDIGMVGPRVLYPDGRFQVSCHDLPTLWGLFCEALCLDKLFPRSTLLNPIAEYRRAPAGVRDVDVLIGAFWFLRRSTVEKVGLLDEDFFFYAEDIDYCMRLRRLGIRLEYDPGALVFHHHGASSRQDACRYYIERHCADMRYWYKHYGRGYLIAAWALMVVNEIVRIVPYTIADVLKRTNAGTIRHIRCLRWLGGAGCPIAAVPRGIDSGRRCA